MSINQIQKEKFFANGNTLPKCVNDGCQNNVTVRNWGNWSFKSECSRCIRNRKLGIVTEGVTVHKKRYCENHNGHLGFQCPVPKDSWTGFEVALDLDHLDGDHDNNTPENVKTYCKLCHNRKGQENGDHSNKKRSSRVFDK